jgi:hypothetical protein
MPGLSVAHVNTLIKATTKFIALEKQVKIQNRAIGAWDSATILQVKQV